jgi:hypothetical protein
MQRWKLFCAAGCVFASGCSKDAPTSAAQGSGRIVVALTIDWEGAYLSPDGLDTLESVRHSLGDVPFTQFVSAAYFTKLQPDRKVAETIAGQVHPHDELAVHLHAWRSLAKASGIEPKLSPSFQTGDGHLMEFEDGDVGFDVDLDAYGVDDLRALLRTSRRLLEQTHRSVSRSFRPGGFLGTQKVLAAAQAEGYRVDSSATDYRLLRSLQEEQFLANRVHGVWPRVDTASQPFAVHTDSGEIVEMPIAAFAEYVAPAQIVGLFDSALKRLQASPDRDVFVVLGFHQETAADFASRIVQAMATVRARSELSERLFYTTMSDAGQLARKALPSPK